MKKSPSLGRKKILAFLVLLVAMFFWIGVKHVYAVDLSRDIIDLIEAGAGENGAELGTPVDIRILAASIIEVFLAILGTIFFILMVMSGYWLITARGEEEKETKAIDTIRRATIGLIIVLMSYGIVRFVTSVVLRANDPEALSPRSQSVRDAAAEARQ